MRGFTLLELLVVMAIVSILTAIAVPRYQEYKARAFDVKAQSDLRNAAIAEEAHFIDNEEYLSCQDAGCAALPGITALSRGVTLQITATSTGFAGSARHERGSGRVYEWVSSEGGLQQ